MKGTLSIVIVLGFAVLLVIFTIGLGVRDLAAKPAADPDNPQKGEVIEVEIAGAAEMFELKHYLNDIIHIYSDHFYITISEDAVNTLVVQQTASWHKKSFDSDNLAAEPMTVKALVRKSGDELSSAVTDFNRKQNDAQLTAALYADATYKTHAVLSILTGVLVLTTAATFIAVPVLSGSGKIANRGVIVLRVLFFVQLLAVVLLLVFGDLRF